MAIASAQASMTERAKTVIPGGVNSGNRALPWPLVVKEAHGAHFTDIDGRQYLDYHAAFGPYILGHNHPEVNAAVQRAMQTVDLIGAGVTIGEIELAEKIVEHVPSAERVLLANSGSEATFQALRLSRAVTGRSDIVKFQGTYHGWHDAVLTNIISPAERIGKPDPGSLGMLQETLDHTIVLPFNDVDAVRETLRTRGDTIAAILVEIIPHNIGCILPTPEFLQTLREEATRYGVVLIFDEVITGFRHGLGGYQKIAGVTPDLTSFAKAMANGYPIAAMVGRADLMEWFAPGQGVFFAGTYNGHPLNVAAALETIRLLEDGTVHAHCYRLAERAADGIQAIADELGITMTVARFGSVFVPYFLDGPIQRYDDLLRSDNAADVAFRQGMCDEGIFMIPTALKRNHVSAAHTDADIDRTLEAARKVLTRIAGGT